MTKTAFIKYLARTNRRSQAYYQTALNEILTGLREQLSEGRGLALIGFGTFYTSVLKAHEGRNPKNGKPLSVPALRLVRFRPGEVLRKAVQRKAASSASAHPQRRVKLPGFLRKK